MPGISQHPLQVTSYHRLAGAALLHINGSGLHALPTPIRIVVPLVIAATVRIGSRVATRLLIRRVAAPNARSKAATAPKDGPTTQDEESDRQQIIPPGSASVAWMKGAAGKQTGRVTGREGGSE